MRRKPSLKKIIIALFSLTLTAMIISVPVRIAAEIKSVLTLTSNISSMSSTTAEGDTSSDDSTETLPVSEADDEKETETMEEEIIKEKTVEEGISVEEADVGEVEIFTDGTDVFFTEIRKLKNYSGSKDGISSVEQLSEKKKVPKYKKNVLDVPSYKQTDSRWKYRRIGAWGSTLGSIGCATTALAMAESFHSGRTVTPDAMAGRLSYSASGKLYWPSEYTEEKITSSNYIERIYNLLSKGKPVVLGMKKFSGGQHWVVVTGHKKNAFTLKIKNFSINDPGSKTRKDLSDFLAEYPIPYKMVYRK